MQNKMETNIQDIKQKSAGFKNHYITVMVRDPINDFFKVEKFFSDLFHYLKDNNISILQQKVYGAASEKEKILSIMNKMAEKIDKKNIFSATFIEGASCIGGVFTGMHIIGVSSESFEIDIKNIEHDGKNVGRSFETPFFKEIFLSGISDYEKAYSLYEHASFMFYKAKEILEKEKCGMNNVIRTWIYFPRILDWYGEFNKARNKCFEEFCLISDDKIYMPASTGIQGKRLDAEECFMDVFAFIPKDEKEKISVMKNKRQKEAYEYGSSFARGIKISDSKISRLYISGTASIDTTGKTVYHNDIQGQITETLLNIAALLDTEDAKLKDIVLATAYCKNKEVYEKAESIIKYLDLDAIPFIYTFADVCRDDLLFEVEAIAVK